MADKDNPFIPKSAKASAVYAVPEPDVTYMDNLSGSDFSQSLSPFDLPDYDDLHDLEEGNKKGCVSRAQINCINFFKSNSSSVFRYMSLIFIILYSIYFGFAVAHSVDGATALIVLTCIVLVISAYEIVKKYWGKSINRRCIKPLGMLFDRAWPYLQW